jgi:predicted kinase
MAYGCTFHDYLERQVWATAFTMVRALFLAGHSTVILVATNTTRKRRKEWHALDWTLRYKVIPTPVEECIRRATDDNNPDLIQVIERMNAQWEELDQYELLDLWEG